MAFSLENSLKSLKVGALNLQPAFAADQTEYSAVTTNNTNVVTVAADYPVTITLNGATMENGKAAAWLPGVNILKISVADGLTYTVTVTKE